MRIVVAPDAFGETLTAVEAARAIADGWRSIAPDDVIDLTPMSDGGPGFIDVLAAATRPARFVDVRVEDPLGRPVGARVLLAGDIAYVESAQACGLHLLATNERDPRVTSTRGVGQLVQAAIDAGARTIVVGLGGSGTNDGGRGLWEVVGDAIPDGIAIVAATDVDNPLVGPNGASAVFGPQKGADRAMVLDLDDALRRWSEEVGRPDLRDAPGAGAAGGLGFALLALGGQRDSGFGVVADAVGLRARIADADLVVTGEGSFDAQSLRGKVPAGVARLAQEAGVPCIVVAGRVEAGRRDAAAAGIDEMYAVTDVTGSVEAALAAGADGVRAAAAQAARGWSVGGG